MTLPVGFRLGPYEILAPIGAGGMGEVYRARDTRLGRDVAIKVLPAALALDPMFKDRFEREAKSISALSHPGICTLHDIGHQDGIDFLVMECLEGETLAARLSKGPLPLAEALRIAIDIAGALDRAHRQGIVHRDLKPGNVMLTKSGAKLLDFGLAKAAPAGLFSGAAALATMTSPAGGAQGGPLTAQGTILGTFQYMAPEQIEGEEVDARADIFAFGAVFFETLTAQKAFSGKSATSLMGAILKDDPPPVSRLQPLTPPALDYLVRTCLAKDREARVQTAHDVLLQLRWIAESGSAAGVPAPVAMHRKRRGRAAAAAIVGLAALLLAALIPAAMYFRTSPAAQKVAFIVNLPELPNVGWLPAFAISPDGRLLAYAAPRGPGAVNVVWVRPIGALGAEALPGTEGASELFWSPDSQSIAFFSRGTLKRIDAGGGPAQDLCALSAGATGTWGRNGVIVISNGLQTGASLFRVQETGGPVTQLLEPDLSRQLVAYRSPSFLPDGRRFLFLAWSLDPAKRAIYAASLDGGEPVLIVNAESQPIYVRPGFLAYRRGGTLLAHPFDARTLTLSGTPAVIAENVRFSPVTGRGAFSLSDTGALAYSGGAQGDFNSVLAWFSRDGKPLGTLGDAAPFVQVRLSPDERRVAVALPDARSSVSTLWTIDVATSISSPLRLEHGGNDPVWSPDSSTVLFEAMPKGRRDFYSQAVGSRDSVLVFESQDDPKWIDDWSHDGRFVLYHLPNPSSLYVLPMSGAPAERTPRLLLEQRSGMDSAHFSPDDKWVAYASDESGDTEVWVAAFPAFDKRRKVSARGGRQPLWRADGTELFYLAPDGRVMSAHVARDGADGTLEFHAPVPLFQSPIPAPASGIDQFAVTRDGRRFLFIQPQPSKDVARSDLRVIVNWQASDPGSSPR